MDVPPDALVLLIGPSGSGKSTFAARHFRETEVVSSDRCRALVSDDEGDQSATPAAFRILHALAGERLRRWRRVVVDATNLKAVDRSRLLELARPLGRPTVAILFDVPVQVSLERNRGRGERVLPDQIIRRQYPLLTAAREQIEHEGFDQIYVLPSAGYQ